MRSFTLNFCWTSRTRLLRMKNEASRRRQLLHRRINKELMHSSRHSAEFNKLNCSKVTSYSDMFLHSDIVDRFLLHYSSHIKLVDVIYEYAIRL